MESSLKSVMLHEMGTEANQLPMNNLEGFGSIQTNNQHLVYPTQTQDTNEYNNIQQNNFLNSVVPAQNEDGSHATVERFN